MEPPSKRVLTGDEAFLDAVDRSDIDRVKELIDDVKESFPKALVRAASSRDLNVFTLILNAHAYWDYEIDNALVHAAMSGSVEIVQFLIDEGANFHVDADIAFRVASDLGHAGVVEVLLTALRDNDYKCKCEEEDGCDDCQSWVFDADDVLFIAVRKNYPELADIAIRFGANKHLTDDGILKTAVFNEHVALVDVLVSHGAPVTSVDLRTVKDPRIRERLTPPTV